MHAQGLGDCSSGSRSRETSRKDQITLALFSCEIADLSFDLNRPGRYLRIGDKCIHPYERRRCQFDTSDDPIPIPLGVVADTVRILSNINHQTIVHPDREHMATRGDATQIVDVRSCQGVVCSDESSIEPHAGFPMRPL
ncbi:hypothetical protein SDC9_184576 [bioreactor metagenome]|uniref:Uncharacterized protein n=1 Tax=bioreactor metagenome TaxID=1076179 RepID=A0A645HEB2_9ZZZZ